MSNLNILIVEGNNREDSQFFIKVAGASAADNLKNLILKIEPLSNVKIINPAHDDETTNALKNVDIAIYLVHSMQPSTRMNQGSFEDTDILLADNFSRAAEQCKLKQTHTTQQRGYLQSGVFFLVSCFNSIHELIVLRKLSYSSIRSKFTSIINQSFDLSECILWITCLGMFC